MTDTCRGCRAPIMWAETETGRRMPLDRDPVPNGNVIIVRDRVGEAPPVVRVVPAGQPTLGLDGEPLTYVSHFATCPEAAEFRRRGR